MEEREKTASIWNWLGFGRNKTGEVRNEITTSGDLEQVIRAHFLNPEAASGIAVSPDRAMRFMAVYACVRVLAESVAQLPLIIYRRLDNGGKERATDHWLYTLLHDRPNAWQTSFEWREMMQAHLALRGNAYSFKNVVRGRVVELLPLHPDRVKPKQLEDYSIFYEVDFPNGRREDIPASSILHLRGLSWDGLVGINPISYAREAVGLGLATERHGANIFGNGARPSGVLSTEQELNDEQIKRIAATWREAHGGGKSGGTAVLDGGMKWSGLSMNAEDSQFLETRKFQRNEIATLFRVPPHMIGDLERSTFSNIEQQSLEFVKYTLMPWLRRWETALSLQLLQPNERDKIFAEFLVEGLLRGDSASRATYIATMVQNKIITRNEARISEGRDPVEGGDEFENPAITPNDPDGDDEPGSA